ncbi:hypothetical protein MIR68_007105 [Amoeboaphelidium protococcarum]|nr:hypothetical protein MIR68_007105 [Amoeboaphelidium protococcarum]
MTVQSMTAVEGVDKNFMKYLDVHLALKYIRLLKASGSQSEDDLNQAMLTLLDKTRQMDAAIELAQKVGKANLVKEFESKREQITKEVNDQQRKTLKFQDALNDEALKAQFTHDRSANMALIQSKVSIGTEEINALISLMHMLYDCGKYKETLSLAKQLEQVTNYRKADQLWLQLACTLNAEEGSAGAMESWLRLRDELEVSKLSPQAVFMKQAWLANWSLFVLNSGNVFDDLLQSYLASHYQIMIQNECPHLMRYVIVCYLLQSSSQGNKLAECVQLVKEDAQFTLDPIVKWFTSLHVDFDFDQCSALWPQITDLLHKGVFLHPLKDKIINGIRHELIRVYGRTLDNVPSELLLKYLNLNGTDQLSAFVAQCGDKFKLQDGLLRVQTSQVPRQLTLLSRLQEYARKSERIIAGLETVQSSSE